MSFLDELLGGIKRIAQNGSLLPAERVLNLTGSGFTVADNPAIGTTDVGLAAWLAQTPTAHLIHSGETYTLLATDAAIIFDTSGGSTATAQLIAPSSTLWRCTFYWYAWGAPAVPPTILAPGGLKMVPFSGQAVSGSAGLVSSTTISTPGAAFTLAYDGTELMNAGLTGGALLPVVPTWTRINTAGTGGQLPSGTILTNAQIAVLLDTTAGAAIARAPTEPGDGQPLTLKDPNGHWGATPGALQLNGGQRAELPATPGTFSAAGALVQCWAQAGASHSWSYDSAQNAYLLD